MCDLALRVTHLLVALIPSPDLSQGGPAEPASPPAHWEVLQLPESTHPALSPACGCNPGAGQGRARLRPGTRGSTQALGPGPGLSFHICGMGDAISQGSRQDQEKDAGGPL